MQKGHRKLCIRTVDTDVVTLAITMFSQINPDELWLAFGSKLHFRYIPIHEVGQGIGSSNVQNFASFSCIYWM